MKGNQSLKVQNQKKDKKEAKDKIDKKEAKDKIDKKEKSKEKENKKDKKDEKAEESESEDSYYTPEEIVLLDKFHDFSGHKFDDNDIYEVMLKFKNDEELIKNELKEMLKVLKKGDEYTWTEIGKSNYIFFNLFII